MATTHKEMTAHLRSRLKHEGIKARVKMVDSCGTNWIHVDVPVYGQSFTPDQSRMIAFIADANKLTYVRGVPIDCSPAFCAQQPLGIPHFSFVFHG